LGRVALNGKVGTNLLLRAFWGHRTMRYLEGDFCVRKAKAPSAVLAEGPVQKMLLDDRVKLDPDALDLASVLDVDLLDHSLEERLLRFGRRLGE
jgi:hypothetical protein